MSKAKKLLDEIESQLIPTREGLVRIIEKHFRDVHDEAVAATVMANNKKRFVKPQYND